MKFFIKTCLCLGLFFILKNGVCEEPWQALRTEGEDKAPVKIYVFSSLTCPHCVHFNQDIEPKIKEQFVDTGKAQLIFVEMARDSKGMEANQIARCLNPKDYSPFMSSLYASKNVWRIGEEGEGLKTFAQKFGIKEEDFKVCIQNKKIKETVSNQQRQFIQRFKVQKIPSLGVLKAGKEIIFTANQEKIVLDKLKEIIEK